MVETIDLYHFEPKITTLGPGKRAGIWFQGCQRDCPGCLVPESHPLADGTKWQVSELVKRITNLNSIEGVSISGGEPFLQPDGLLAVLSLLKRQRSDFSVVLFTGFYLNELHSLGYSEILEMIDILVDGPFQIQQQIEAPWRASANQRVHLLSNRYTEADQSKQKGGVEFFLRSYGGVFLSGIPPKGFIERFRRKLHVMGIDAGVN